MTEIESRQLKTGSGEKQNRARPTEKHLLEKLFILASLMLSSVSVRTRDTS